MDKYRQIWDDFILKILSKDYDNALEKWDPQTRFIFRKNIKNFRKRHCQWKKIEYIGTTSDGYVIIRYALPKGIVARSALAFNRNRLNNSSGKYGDLLFKIYTFLKKMRERGCGLLYSYCGVLLRRFDVVIREFRSDEVIKKYAIIHDEDTSYLGWSYINTIIPDKISYQYSFDTFVFISAVNYSLHLPMLFKLDDYIKKVLRDFDRDIPKINIYFHGKLNSPGTGIPKSIFVVPGRNSICIYHIRIKYDDLCHEMLHAIIYAATLSWPTLFFREGYAESYKDKKNCKQILRRQYPISLLLYDFSFFDYTEYPPQIAGLMVRFLIDQYGAKKFFKVYKKAEFISTKKALKEEYGLTIKELKKRALLKLQQDTVLEY